MVAETDLSEVAVTVVMLVVCSVVCLDVYWVVSSAVSRDASEVGVKVA